MVTMTVISRGEEGEENNIVSRPQSAAAKKAENCGGVKMKKCLAKDSIWQAAEKKKKAAAMKARRISAGFIIVAIPPSLHVKMKAQWRMARRKPVVIIMKACQPAKRTGRRDEKRGNGYQ